MKRSAVIAIGGLLFLSVILIPTAISSGVLNPLAPGLFGDATIQWRVKQSPDVPFQLFYSGNEKWIAENGSIMSFQITKINDDFEGIVKLGNSTWRGNDTDLARDLTLGVWGKTAWLPGLLIHTDEKSIEQENATAYKSALRVYGNYLNGTIDSKIESIELSGKYYNCINFYYVQDEPLFGDPQILRLSYDLNSGILVYANVYYSFGVPYTFEIALLSVSSPLASSTLILVSFTLFLIAAVYAISKR